MRFSVELQICGYLRHLRTKYLCADSSIEEMVANFYNEVGKMAAG